LVTAKGSLEKQIEDFRSREKDQIIESKNLKDQMNAAVEAKVKLEKEVEKFSGVDLDSLKGQLESLQKERDEINKKVETITAERQDLLAKLEAKAEPQVIYKYVDQQGNEVEGAAPAQGQEAVVSSGTTAELSQSDELYWAQILKERTALELEVEKLRGELSQTAVQATELKKKNSDLQLELTKLINDKEEIERQIKYGKDLSDSLSLELARAQNDKKFLNDRLVKMNGENSGLREQIKQLTSTKIALEKSIVLLQDEKKEVEHKLSETENVIQGRIDEIWDIKKDLDQSFGPEAKKNSQVELPPIIVSSKEVESDVDPNIVTAPGINGNIVSVNNENNFVIIDIGKDQGIGLGDSLNVYRGAEYVAGLEVIQIREDIAAADIISKVADIKVGDAVR
jgi:chromosome segregation ATPase